MKNFCNKLVLSTVIMPSIIIWAGTGVDSANAGGRDYLTIVGSSTVYPFSTVVAENFGKTSGFRTPKVESTGSGGGFKLFCNGVGIQHPDITNASRRIKKSEVERCRSNGVTSITEVKIGYDGIVLANSKSSPQMNISLRDIYLALAKDIPGKTEGELIPNPNKTWKDVNSSLPDVKIEVMGPPPTSGTRDAFAELALEGGCKTFSWVKKMKKQDKKRYKAVCHAIREDGAYIEAGENDVLIVRKLEANPRAFGVFGFSFLDQNGDKIQGSIISSEAPEFEKIASGEYPLSRPLYFYVKNAHSEMVPGVKEFVKEFTSERAYGEEGYLTDKGLIPMPEHERVAFRKQGSALVPLKF